MFSYVNRCLCFIGDPRYGVKVQPASYTIQDGDYHNANVSLMSSQDTSYDGNRSQTSPVTLSGGLGKLTDGDVAMEMDNHDNSSKWVRWNSTRIYMDFFFSAPTSICQIDMQVYGDHLQDWAVAARFSSERNPWGDTTFDHSQHAELSGKEGRRAVVLKIPQRATFLAGDGRAGNRTTTSVRIELKESILPFKPGPQLLAISEVTFFRCGE